MVSKKALDDFKKIYLEEYGVALDDATALELAVNWLNFMDTVYRPIKKEWSDSYDQREKKGGNPA